MNISNAKTELLLSGRSSKVVITQLDINRAQAILRSVDMYSTEEELRLMVGSTYAHEVVKRIAQNDVEFLQSHCIKPAAILGPVERLMGVNQ